MARIITQILIGLMLLFGGVTLLPKAYFDFKAKKIVKGIISSTLCVCAFFFSYMAFYYAYLLLKDRF